MEESPDRSKLDLNSELGLTRRDLLRRGAIVAGTLVWAAPAIQSMAPKALAAQGPSPGVCAACYCWNGAADKSSITADEGGNDGIVAFRFSSDACENWCKWQDVFAGNGAPGGPYQHDEYCSGNSFCDFCSQAATQNPSSNCFGQTPGVQCG